MSKPQTSLRTAAEARRCRFAYGWEVGTADNQTLIEAAAAGDQSAWNEIVRRFEALVWSVTYEFRLPQAAREDVFQLTWLRLLDSIDRIREPERLAGWLATTARRECLAVVRSSARLMLVDQLEDRPTGGSVDAMVLADERLRAVMTGLAELGERCQQLIRLLAQDPRVEYVDIAEIMGLAVGSIGPIRQRCLDRLRSRPSVANLLAVGQRNEEDER